MKMRLTTLQSYAALEKFGCYVTEACDKCGRLLARCATRGAGILACGAAANVGEMLKDHGSTERMMSGYGLKDARTLKGSNGFALCLSVTENPLAASQKQRTCRRENGLCSGTPLTRLYPGARS
jgi:hypothetical protein